MTIKSILLMTLVLASQINAQDRQKPDGKRDGGSATAAVAETADPSEIARIALARQGGDKFRNLKNLSLFGTAVLYYGSEPSDTTSGQFAIVNAGDRSRTDVETPEVSYREIYDGNRAYCVLKRISAPPPSKFGMAVIAQVDRPGYTTTALADNKKKQRGFRVSDSEGNATDFYVDPATGRIMEFSFTYKNIKFTTEHKSFKEVEGVLVPYSFLRIYGLPRVDIYMEFKVKEAKVNQQIGDDVFIIPER
jgi:hypothetical protein